MAHGGRWTLDQRIYLVVMKLASTYGWPRVAQDFRVKYGSKATQKDCESKFNKDLKKSTIFRIVTDWLESSTIPEDAEDIGIFLDAVVMIGDIPLEHRRA